MKRSVLIPCLFLLYCLAAHPSRAAVDTARVFTMAELKERMFRYHPVVRQADLLSAQARARVMQAWGKFDPLLRAGYDRKDFGDKLYYDKWSSELKVPLWLGGADLKAGYDRGVGDYVNPEYYTGSSGLALIGLSVPLGQGFIIDERRRVLRQARVLVGYAEAERVKQIVSVWYEAVQDYWNWYNAWAQYQLLTEGVQLAQTRFTALRNQAFLGDKPAIDTVEAIITLQDRQQQVAKATVELQNMRLMLSNHLWSENGEPLELPADAQPQPVDRLPRPDEAGLDSLLRQAAGQHPDLLKFRSKLAEMEIDRQYWREQLKPKLNVTGSLLSRRTGFGEYVPSYYDYGIRNYKVGVDFAFPLLLRSERGKLAETRFKLQSTGFDLQNADRRIRTGVYTSYNALRAYEQQLEIQVSTIRNQQSLLTAELQKFDLGESTLFLINSRESKLIDLRLKRVELVANYQKKLAELYYKVGTWQSAP